jgi:hypothetical protein
MVVRSSNNLGISVYDDFFPIDIQKEIFHKLMTSHAWSYTGGGEISRFWHVDELENDDYFSSFLYDKICQNLNKKFSAFSRIYANGQTSCQYGVPHIDDGDMTFLYYPNLEWQLTWQGGLFFIKNNEIYKTITYKPNRAVLFPAKIKHYADAPSRLYNELRISLAYKLWN